MKLFDLDGTLLDSNGIWEEIDLRFLEKRGIPWSREYHEGVIHAIFPVAARFTKEFCQLAESEEEIMAEWLEMAYDAYAHRLPAKEGAAEYLAACAARGERLALYTSAEPSLAKAALARFGWDRLLRPLVFAQELGMTKGTPGAFAAAARALGPRRRRSNFLTTRRSPAARPRRRAAASPASTTASSPPRRGRCARCATGISAPFGSCCDRQKTGRKPQGGPVQHRLSKRSHRVWLEEPKRVQFIFGTGMYPPGGLLSPLRGDSP